jgi:A/G-specific adenine glycosylase
LWLLWAQNEQGDVWLEKRPSKGVWASLYCLPLFDSAAALAQALPENHDCRHDEPFVHVLTHKDLHLHPVRTVLNRQNMAPKSSEGVWMCKAQWKTLGLPAPIRKLLEM